MFDASGIESSADLVELQRFFYPTVSRVLPSGRVIVLGGGRRALEGFTRSLGKEIGPRGATVNLIHVEEGAEEQLGTDAALLPHAALGLRVRAGRACRAGRRGRRWPGGPRWSPALRADRRGDRRRARARGRVVVRLDLKDADIELDITDPDAPERLAARSEALDILVHNAGVTKDRTLAKMPEDRWQSLMEVNLLAPERITEALLPKLCEDGRIVCVSSMSAIAGNAGQTNYATSKAGLLDLVSGWSSTAGSRSTPSLPGSSRPR